MRSKTTHPPGKTFLVSPSGLNLLLSLAKNVVPSMFIQMQNRGMHFRNRYRLLYPSPSLFSKMLSADGQVIASPVLTQILHQTHTGPTFPLRVKTTLCPKVMNARGDEPGYLFFFFEFDTWRCLPNNADRTAASIHLRGLCPTALLPPDMSRSHAVHGTIRETPTLGRLFLQTLSSPRPK